jgi:DNA-binding CsgD family transcriptional regulator
MAYEHHLACDREVRDESKASQRQGAEKRRMETVIVSSSPVVGVALQHLFEDRMVDLTACCLDLSGLQATPPLVRPDLLVLAPQHWNDLELWLPQLQDRFSASPWLLFLDPRLAGLFVSHLEALRCVFVPTTASPDLLRSAIQTVTRENTASQRPHCLQLLAALLDTGVTPTDCPPWSVAEIQCACAVSLGLSERESTGVLGLSLPVFRRHLRRLQMRLAVSSPHELAAVVQQAFSPAKVDAECRKLYPASAGRVHLRR